MRRLVIFTFGLATLASAGPAAVDAAAQMSVGFRGGLNLSSVSVEGTDEFDSRTALAVGGSITFPLTPMLGVQLGLGYAQKGGTASEQDIDLTLALDYIEVPALLRLEVPTAGTISPHFYLGPTLSFEASCSVKAETSGFSASIDCDQGDPDLDIELATKSVDFGAMGGAGLSIGTAGPLSVTVDVFYNLGLTSIDDSDVPEDVKNRAWSFVAGVELPIG